MAYSLDSSKKNFQITIPDEEFCCPLCMEFLEEPKSLPGCAHSFCKMCINQMLIRNNNTEMSCPVCRSSSRVPPNGADGFPTNTLLVRLMDNIPGRSEKRELQKAMAACKEEIERNTKIRDEIDKRCGIISRSKELAEDLKAQVSEYAEEMIKGIKNCEQNLLKEIEDFVGQRCGLFSEDNLHKTKKKLEATLEQASNCVYSVEDILKKDDLSVILDLKTVMVEQLAEYSKFPAFPGVANGEIRTFDLRLEKDERENLLGKLVSDWAGPKPVRSSSSARVELDRGSSQEDEEGSQSSCTCHSVGAASNSSGPPGFTQGEIITRVDLPFEPFSLAVSPHSGFVALLWKENNKVFLCKGNGQHYSTISIPYGDLWDVGFTIDDHVIVVNRRSNRLLCFTKDGLFVRQEREIPRTGLKYTYLSVCENGCLIVTSAHTDDDDDYSSDDDDDNEIVQCIIVYEADDRSCKRMFGRRHLDNPISRAVFHRGYYYIADAGGRSTVSIRQFSSQGQFLEFFNDAQPSLHGSVSLSIDTDFDRLIVGKHHPSMLWKQHIFGSSDSLFGDPSPHNCPHTFYIHRQEILPKSFHWQCYAGILKIEIYRDLQFFNIVHYR